MKSARRNCTCKCVVGWSVCTSRILLDRHMMYFTHGHDRHFSIISSSAVFYTISETPDFCLLENTRHVYYRLSFFIYIFLPINLYYHFTFLFYHYFLYYHFFFYFFIVYLVLLVIFSVFFILYYILFNIIFILISFC